MNRSCSAAPSLKLKQEQPDHGSLELRLGISSENVSPWLGAGMDPWSLAARQERAVLEQAHQGPDEYALQRENRPAAAAPPQAVGWPPVGSFRKNLSTSKPADGAVAEALFSKVTPGSEDDDGERPAATMFVKVNLEGCAVGRKVDLRAHRGYGSLSRALQGMFHAFLSNDSGQCIIRIAAEDDDEEQQQPETKKKGAAKTSSSYILLYEDNEGDRMLVGDVPWQLFVASVKRLYIARDTSRSSAEHD